MDEAIDSAQEFLQKIDDDKKAQEEPEQAYRKYHRDKAEKLFAKATITVDKYLDAL